MKQEKAIQLLLVYLKPVKNNLFFHFSDLQNLVKCTDSMFPCYSLLNMKVIYMVSAPSPFQWRDLIWKFAKMFSSICGGDKPLWGELKIYGGVIFITTLSLFYFFRNRKHPENWSLSFKNFFWKCECISCYYRYRQIY